MKHHKLHPLAVASALVVLATPLFAGAQSLYEYRVNKPGLRMSAGTGSGGGGNTPVEAPISVELSTATLAFGDLSVAASAEQSVLLTNLSASKALTLPRLPEVTGSSAFSASSQCGGTLAPLASCATTVRFLPSSLGDATGSLSIASNAPNSPHLVALSGRGTGTQFLAYTSGGSPVLLSSLSFTEATVGETSQIATFQLKNEGNVTGTPALLVSPSQFTLAGCSGNLAPGAYCTVSVTFTPSNTSPVSGSVQVSGATVGAPLNLSLSGTGLAPAVPSAQLSATTHAFGDVSVSQTATKTITLTNTSSSKSLSLTSAPVVSGSASLTRTANTCGSSLAPQASCQVTVQFAPTALGEASGKLTFATNAPDTPHEVSFTGRGTGSQFASYSGATSISSLPAFSNVNVGSTSTAQTFEVKNTGNVAGTPVLTVSPAQFAVAGCSTSLAAGASCTASVTFTPTNSTPVSGAVTIAGAAFGGSVDVSVSGTGVVPVVPASLRGDGTSLTGACSSGQTGCVVLSSTDKNAAVTLDAAKRTASASTGTYSFARATMALGSDKYYWEVLKVSGPATSNAYYYCGVSSAGSVLSGTPYNMEPTAYSAYNFNVPNGTVVRCSYNGTTRVLSATYGASVITKTLAAGTYLPMLAVHQDYVQKINFGQENFIYAPPAGYLAGVFTP